MLTLITNIIFHPGQTRDIVIMNSMIYLKMQHCICNSIIDTLFWQGPRACHRRTTEICVEPRYSDHYILLQKSLAQIRVLLCSWKGERRFTNTFKHLRGNEDHITSILIHSNIIPYYSNWHYIWQACRTFGRSVDLRQVCYNKQ